MPTNSRGTFTPLRAPDASQLPESAQAAANEYTVAVRNLADAQTRQADLNSPLAEEHAKAADVVSFKSGGKVAHKEHDKLLADRRDSEQEVTGLTQLAESAEAALIDAAHHATPPDADSHVEESEAQLSRLAQVLALARVRECVARWLEDPTRPYVTTGISSVEQKLQAVRDELAGQHAERSFFDLSGASDISPLDPAQNPSMIRLPGGEQRAVHAVANADDAIAGIR
jgi:hypothetical protein